MRNALLLLLVPALTAVAPVAPVAAQTVPAAPAPPYPYIAELTVTSPVILDAMIRAVTPLRGPDAAGVAAGHARLYIVADVLSALRAPAAMPPRIGYLLDVPLDARGRLPKLRKVRVMLFARAVSGSASMVQLVRPDAQRLWTPALDAMAHRIATEAVAPDAPPAITGIGNAFYVPGALPGEGETQVFLQTADGRPVSISVLSRPGEAKRWAVALSEIVDEAARPPAPETLLWYRLACGLPPALPAAALASLDPAAADAARADYRFVLDSLGPCQRQP